MLGKRAIYLSILSFFILSHTHAHETRARARVYENNVIYLSNTPCENDASVISAKRAHISKTVIKKREGRAVLNTLQIIYIVLIYNTKGGKYMPKTITLRLTKQNLDHLEDIKKFYSTHPEEKTMADIIRFCIERMWDLTPEGQKFYERIDEIEQKALLTEHLLQYLSQKDEI